MGRIIKIIWLALSIILTIIAIIILRNSLVHCAIIEETILIDLDNGASLPLQQNYKLCYWNDHLGVYNLDECEESICRLLRDRCDSEYRPKIMINDNILLTINDIEYNIKMVDSDLGEEFRVSYEKCDFWSKIWYNTLDFRP